MRSKIALFTALFSVIWCIGVVGLYGDISGHSEFSLPMDHHKYLAMASKDVCEFRIAPFCWRIGVPAIAPIVGFGNSWLGFQLLSILGITLATTFSSLLVWDKTGSVKSAVGCVLTLLSLGWITRYSIWNPASVDAMAIGLVALTTYLVFRGRLGLALVVLIAGVLVKESVLIAIVIAPLVAEAGRKKSAVLWLVPSLAVLVAVRLMITAGNADPSYLSQLNFQQRVVQNGVSVYSLPYLIDSVARSRWESFSLHDLNAISLDSFGAVVIVGLILSFMKKSRCRWGVLAVMLTSLLQVFVAVNIQRPILIIAPFIVAFVWYDPLSHTSKRQSVVWLAFSTILLAGTTMLGRMSVGLEIQALVLVGAIVALISNVKVLSR